ncbi:MAG: hydantoinase B/oxoprolinase family protein [Pseudomonadota bacterium]
MRSSATHRTARAPTKPSTGIVSGRRGSGDRPKPESASRHRRRFDAIDLEILWSRLVTLVDEAAYAVRRTSMSKVVVEGGDFSVLLHDPQGRLVAADVSVASKISTTSIAVKEFLKHFPARSLSPGDVLITNNPWWIMGHLNDVAVVAPLFHRGRLVGFAECAAHMADIGGLLSAMGREVYEEGLIIPPLKAMAKDRENADFFALLESNVRVPKQVAGDVRALMAGCRVMEQSLGEFLVRHGLPDLDLLARTILAHCESAMRQGIRANIPDGVYTGASSIDGFDKPLRIPVRIASRDGKVDIDFSGAPPQSTLGINCTLVYTHVWCAFAIKCLAAPSLPNNEGTFAPVGVRAPEGSLLNPTFPAPVKMKSSTGHYVPIAIFDALRDVIPRRMLAESGKKSLLYLSGRDRSGKSFSDLTFVMGGMGARATKDGLHATSFPGNTASIPVEVLEQVIPVRVRHKRLRPDSGGAGKFRGGCGLDFELESVSSEPLTAQAEHGKLKTPPAGSRGGSAGAAGETLLNGQPIPDKVPVSLRPGDVLRMLVPGGGGMYPARERDGAACIKDVENGVVSTASARRDYGVAAPATKPRPAAPAVT